jgi:CheY-like chemotaxis protein
MPSEQRTPTVLIIQDQADTWRERKAALEKAGFRVVEVKNHDDAALSLRDSSMRIDLLVTSPDFSVPQLQLVAETVDGGAYPIGVQEKLAILLEPVANAELISAARTLLFAERLD